MAQNTAEQAGNGSDECPLDTEVHAALKRLTTSPPLSKSERLCEFLNYIVSETLAGRGDKIMGYSIGVDVFGKPESFDPSVDTIVRVEAGRLRRSLDQYYLEAGTDDPVRILVPKGAYIPEFHYRAGDRMITAQVSPPATVAHKADGRGPSIAVLPFDNFSADPADQFFADGLTEETIANLARFKDLFVFSRSTTSKLSEGGVDIRLLRDELGVDFVVEGSVRKTLQTVRVTVQLIDAATDGHILSENFDRACTPEGVFEIQDEIAQLIAGRVADRHGPLGRYISRAGRTGQSRNWETYHWIIRFYDNYATHNPDTHLEVRNGLTAALESDPESSDGHAALSLILLDEYRLHINERPGFPALETALSHAQIAVTSRPENAFAHQALALSYYHSREFTDFRMSAERAIELNPGHADVLADMGHCYAFLGDYERGLALISRALELSPVHPGWYHHAPSIHLAMNGASDEAIVELKKVPMPGFIWHHCLLAWFHAEAGDLDAASKEVDELLAILPDFCSIVHGELAIWCVNDAMADKAISGWRKAGLDIP